MKIEYDENVDVLYLRMGRNKPDGVVEISEGIGLDTTSDDRIVGIEILNASKRINLQTMFSYEVHWARKKVSKTA